MKLKNKVKILELLGAGELEKALDELVLELKASKSGADFLKTARSLSGQLGKLKKDKLDGVITYEQESVAFNKLQVKLQTLVETIEKDKPNPPPTNGTTSGPKNPPPTPPQKSSNWWPWLAIPALAFGWWWLFMRQGPITATIRICTSNDVSMNYCQKDVMAFTAGQTLQGLVVTAAFEGLRDNDPLIEGKLKKLNGDDFPTRQIQLTMQPRSLFKLDKPGTRCYLGPEYLCAIPLL